jgi:UDP:flavonoid glycosyltransferase YjiC (YdhE family)
MMAHGSRGDVQPLVAIGAECQRRGHEVVLAAPVNMVSFIEESGLKAAPLPGDTHEWGESAEVRRMLADGDVTGFLAGLRAFLAGHGPGIVRALYEVTDGTDLIVSALMTEDVAAVIAEARQAPLVLLHSFPTRRNRVVANPMVTGRSSRLGPVNWFTHIAYDRAAWRERSPRINALRKQFGLAETRLSTSRRAAALGALELQAYSPNVIGGRGWPRHRPIVGWPRLGQQDRATLRERGLPADLEGWLAAGPPPVYVGFGSVPVPDPVRLITAIDAATAELGLRAVICSGSTDLSAAGAIDPDRLRTVGAVDHDALLPRCRIAVHHGGSGTTAAVTRAGIPMLICSLLVDQLLWGQRMERLGCGVHLRYPDLSSTTLTAALRRLLDPAFAAAADRLGRAVNAEPDAVRVSADLILAHAAAGAARRATPGADARSTG